MKTKIGISAGLMGAALYLFGLLSGYGYIILILLAGYILLREENQWLRYVAVKAMALCLFFFVLSTAVGLIPDILNFIGSIISVFNGTFTYTLVSNLVAVVTRGINLVRTVLLLLLGLKALRQGDIPIRVLDKKVRSFLFH